MNQPKQTQTAVERLLNSPVISLTPLQQHVMNLYSLGFNVFPMPYGRKSGYSWGMLQYTRLNPEDIYTLFDGQANVAIMTGRTSLNLFVIDCETQQQFKAHEKELHRADIPIWATESGGAGRGGHFYLLSKDGEVKGVRAGERKDYEVRGNRCYVLAPPSLHPDTRRLYQWYARETVAPPIVTLEQVSWLSLQLAKNAPKEIEPKPFNELSESTQQFILTGAQEGERNNRLFAAACDMAGNDYDPHTTLQLLEPIAMNVGLPRQEIRTTINSAYSQPRTPSKPKSENDQPPVIHDKAFAFAKNREWKGRAGQTNRAVFVACCQRAVTCNEKGIFRASVREVAELARITAKTASTAIRRLVKENLLVYCGQDHLSHANLYRFGHVVFNSKNSRYYHTKSLPVGKGSVVTTGKNDALERGALGKTAFTLYSFMVEDIKPKSVKELTTTSKLSVKQIYRALRKLREFNLIKKEKNRYTAIPLSDNELDEFVAKPAGVYGKGKQRVELHQWERARKAAEKLYKERWGKGREIVPVPQSKATVWACGNCGQQWSMADLDPPLVCDFCGDATTWKLKRW